jgi:hypothetical protein
MTRKPTPLTKRFTICQANATLPLVRAITGDLVRLAQDVLDRRQRLAALSDGRGRDGKDPYQEELNQIAEQLDEDSRQLQQYMDELRQIGVEPRSALEGIVDFPSMLDGRSVYLCWKLGDPDVRYYHEMDAGFEGRQPLGEQLGAGGGRH